MTTTAQKFNDIVSQFMDLKCTQSFNAVKDEIKVKKSIEEIENLILSMKENDQVENSLFVSKLHEKYIEVSFQVFSFSADEHLKNLFQIFEKAYPEESFQIKKYWNVYSFSKGVGNIMLKGDIQSGKTAMMVLTSLCYLVCNRDVVIILRTSNDDKIQFIERFEEIVNEIRKYGYTNKNFEIFDYQNKKTPFSNQKYCFISIYMKTKMKNFQKLMANRGNDFVLYIDEADLRDNNESNKNFCRLKNMTNTSIFVSGTVSDIMVTEWDIYGSNIVKLTPNSEYRGIDKIQWITDWDITTRDGVYWTLQDIAHDTEYEELYPYHPRIVLVTTDTKIKELNYYYKEFRKQQNFMLEDCYIPKQFENVCVIKYGDKGLRLYHNSFQNQVFSGNFVPTSHNGNELIFNSSGKMTIKTVLLWLAQNGGKTRFPNIVILAGKKADRGINFACYDPIHSRNNWHITHQVLFKAKESSTTKCATLIQSLRILGKFKDNIPLKVYTSEYEKNMILGSYNLTNEILNSMTEEDHKFFKTEFRQTKTDEICKLIPIKKSSIHKNYIRKPIRSTFTLVEDFEDGINVSDKRVENIPKDSLDEKEIERMEERIVNWYYDFINTHKPNIKISKVLKLIKPNTLYKIRELYDIFDYCTLSRSAFVHFFDFETPSCTGYGKILRDNKDGSFQIYPELNEVFSKTFAHEN